MIRKTLIAFVAVVLTVGLQAKGPKELEAAKAEFEKAGPKGGEAARVKYVTALAKVMNGYVKELRKSGDHAHDSDIVAINAELRQHPAPKDVDAKKLSALRIGKWGTTRHDLLFRKDGTYAMLPLEDDPTTGQWKIEGNVYVDTTADDKAWRYTIILLDANYFVYSDKEYVFFELRLSK